MQNTNKIKPAFPLSLLTCALALATGVASAQTIEVTNGKTYGSSSKPSVAKPNETKMFRSVFPNSLKKCCFLP